MVALGEFLAGLHGPGAQEQPGNRYSTLECEFRHWRHTGRAHHAADEYAAAHDAHRAPAQQLHGSRPVELEERLALWIAPPGRVREEIHEDDVLQRSGVRVGSQWWTYDARSGAIASDRDDARPLNSGIGDRLGIMLDPWLLASSLRFEALDGGHRAGRATLRARAVPHASAAQAPHNLWLHYIGVGADTYELELDAERGVILRVEARRDDRPFEILEAITINFDRSLPAELFDLQAPGPAAPSPPP